MKYLNLWKGAFFLFIFPTLCCTVFIFGSIMRESLSVKQDEKFKLTLKAKPFWYLASFLVDLLKLFLIFKN